MDSFEIVLPEEALSRSRLGRVQGQLFVRVGGKPFPRDAWEDDPLNIMRWWGDAIRRYRNGRGQEIVLDFMDGPWLMEMAAAEDPEMLKLELCTGDREIRTPVGTAVIGLESLTLTWLEAAETLLTWCEQQDHCKSVYWAIKTHYDSMKAVSMAYV